MTNAPKDGGPAFACAAENGHQPGMSLRDWFAGQALAGFVSDAATLGGFDKSAAELGMNNGEIVAAAAYKLADAMLAARNPKDSP